ncbi:hypothetical protein PoB_003583800 [Plakobranchus ocellatus]|uniref:Uncharacterized protein n=1 Tax=Plakobranchus ocellatus TaxID=259542 RepID=A0AAV4AR83_9GAST|nr:hypothetical protein PoB_003583800 [Plakobranchus ocellatus]
MFTQSLANSFLRSRNKLPVLFLSAIGQELGTIEVEYILNQGSRINYSQDEIYLSPWIIVSVTMTRHQQAGTLSVILGRRLETIKLEYTHCNEQSQSVEGYIVTMKTITRARIYCYHGSKSRYN